MMSKATINFCFQLALLASVDLLLFYCKYSTDKIPVAENCIPFNMPSDAKKACEEHSACCGWAADQYGHLNLFVGADHQLYYHKRYKPFDEDPCHHLHPDKTQLWVLPEEFDRCGLKDVGPVISAVLREHHNPPIITFSFAEGARYMDMIYLIDAFDSLKVQIYIQRDMTSSEKNALSLLQMRNRKY